MEKLNLGISDAVWLFIITLAFVFSRLIWVMAKAWDYGRKKKRVFYVLNFDFLGFQKYLKRNGYSYNPDNFAKPDIHTKEGIVKGVYCTVKCTGIEYEEIKARIDKK